MSYQDWICFPPRMRSAVYVLLFASLLLFIAPPSFSDEGGWAATYGGETLDDACSLCETSDGGYVVAGWTGPLGPRRADAWVLKLRQDGTIEWQKTYGGVDSFHSAESIHKTSEGGCIVAGYTRPFGAKKFNLWVLKLKTDGTIEWQKTYGGTDEDLGKFIQQTSDGGYIVAGVTNSFGAGKSDFWVLKLRPDGTVEWQKTYGGVDEDKAKCIQQTREGGYIVAGKTESFGAGAQDFWLIKLGSDGTIEWQKTYGGKYWDQPHSIQQTSDGGYIILSSFSGLKGITVLKLGPDGGVEWQKTYTGVDWVLGRSMFQTSDGGYIVAGGMMPFSRGSDDVLIFKLRADGTIEWQKTYGGDLDASASSIMQTRDGCYVVAGWIGDPRTSNLDFFDFLVLKLRPDGSISPTCNLVKDTVLAVEDTSVIVESTSISPVNSNATLQDSSATAQDTDALAKFLCP